MQRRTGDAKTKALIIREGLTGTPGAEIGPAPPITQSLYEQWRDQFLANAANAFDTHQQTRKEARLEQENARLQQPSAHGASREKNATHGGDETATLASSRGAC